MKDRIDAILQRRQAEYLGSLIPPREPLLAEMEHYAAEHGHPIADPEVGQLMGLIVRLKKPKRLLEIGTNIGYSVVVMGRHCDEDAVIETIELDEAILQVAKRFVAQAALHCDVIFHSGAALEVLPKLEGPFDFVFIDCVKTEYIDYLDTILPALSPGAVIFCDNLLWKGQVAEGGKDASTSALRAFNERITTDSRLMTTILPVGDGVGLSIVR